MPTGTRSYLIKGCLLDEPVQLGLFDRTAGRYTQHQVEGSENRVRVYGPDGQFVCYTERNDPLFFGGQRDQTHSTLQC